MLKVSLITKSDIEFNIEPWSCLYDMTRNELLNHLATDLIKYQDWAYYVSTYVVKMEIVEVK